jgi:hypothetical protein
VSTLDPNLATKARTVTTTTDIKNRNNREGNINSKHSLQTTLPSSISSTTTTTTTTTTHSKLIRASWFIPLAWSGGKASTLSLKQSGQDEWL